MDRSSAFITSGPCMPMVLEKSDAVAALRTAIGATDPSRPMPGPSANSRRIEGAERDPRRDSDENATRESRFFFSEAEI